MSLVAEISPQHADVNHKLVSAPPVFAFWHLASLDAPTVAVVWSLTFAWSMGVHLPWWIPVVQALGTWIVYVADRLLDARRALRRGNTDALRDRHFFHWRRRRGLLPLSLVAACACALLIFIYMPVTARERNSVLAVATLVYMARVHGTDEKKRAIRTVRFLFLSKELLVGVLFTAGCALPTIARIATSNASLGMILVSVLFFALIAWLNCYAIDRWESTESGRSFVRTAAVGCIVSGAELAWCFHGSQPRSAVLISSGAVSALLLAMLDQMRSRISPLALRASADLALLTPALFLLR